MFKGKLFEYLTPHNSENKKTQAPDLMILSPNSQPASSQLLDKAFNPMIQAFSTSVM